MWQAAFETTDGDGRRLFGDRYALVRLEDLRADPAGELARVYATDRARGPRPGGGAGPAENIRRDATVHLADDPRWARAARLLGMEGELERAGYGEILELEEAPGEPLDLTPPPRPSKLAGFMGRARRRTRRDRT